MNNSTNYFEFINTNMSIYLDSNYNVKINKYNSITDFKNNIIHLKGEVQNSSGNFFRTTQEIIKENNLPF